ncbi:lipase chaperone [Serratia fonticola]|jgi:hypothetical protein|uniref:Uncharacterized protein n=1 Tax=Serratia fonticola TaxID=47917 RepID=A0A0F7H9C5_SERFO|nr:lipase chaperone [Serratia fonticola]AKG69234.1 hypothetical protein WN53_08950 [Serratia fonticola]CAI1006110.1 Uncharacterised protein [Serratia fonticola]CAI1199629.1 Uncharacterised protein [Serratia fonticola]CAI1971604.1 Uncharacterised protein [Serratia fonticola]CAI1997573.1 Uncharacterised protein [Serratia fonticola]
MKKKILLTIFLLVFVPVLAMIYFFMSHTDKQFSCVAKLNTDITESNQSTKALYDIFFLFDGNNTGYVVVEGTYISNGVYEKINTAFDFSYEKQNNFYSIKKFGGKAPDFLPFFLQWETAKFKFSQLNKDDFVISGPINPILLVCTKA